MYFVIVTIFLFIGGTCTKANFCPQNPEKLLITNTTNKYPVRNDADIPPCWNYTQNSVYQCANISRSVNYSLLTRDNPIIHFLPIIESGRTIRRAFYLINASYCYTSINSSAEVNVTVNDISLNSLQPQNTGTCVNFTVFTFVMDNSDCWDFVNYTSKYPDNTLELKVGDNSEGSPSFYMVVSSLTLILETVLFDPIMKYVSPYPLLNPWSQQITGYTYQVGIMYYDNVLIYSCLTVFEDNVATSSLLSATYSTFFGCYIGFCEFTSPPSETFTLNDTKFNNVKIYVVPQIPYDIQYIPFISAIADLPKITTIYPNQGQPNITVTLTGSGFLTKGWPLALEIQQLGMHSTLVQIAVFEYITDVKLSFVLPPLSQLPTNQTSSICFTATLNLHDYSDCNDAIFLYIGPNTTEPAPIPIPSPQIPSPPPSDLFNIILNWMNNNWWIYIVITIIIFCVLVIFTTFVVFKVRGQATNDSDDPVSSSDIENLDPRALINIGELTIREMVGQGSFAVVYRGYWRKTEVAIKMLQNNNVKNEKISFLKECSLMLNLRHPNVVSLMGIVWNPRLCIVTEYCGRGDVAEVMLDSKFIVEQEHIRKICLDTCRGMTYLHGANVIHRDLKSRNLLIDKGWNIKVADFGLARAFDEQPGTMTACGTPTHAAPEVIKHLHYTTKADVYSFGICLWEMCVRQEPYESIPGFQVIVAVATKRMRPKIPSNLDPKFANLIRRCWTEDQELRPDFQELVEIFEDMRLPTPVKKMPYKEDDLSLKKSSNSIEGKDISSTLSTPIKSDSTNPLEKKIKLMGPDENNISINLNVEKSPPIKMPKLSTNEKKNTSAPIPLIESWQEDEGLSDLAEQ